MKLSELNDAWNALTGTVKIKAKQAPQAIADNVYSGLDSIIPSNEAYQQARQGNPKQLMDASINTALNAPMMLTFTGPKSKNWDAEKAYKALKMLDDGVDPAQVWREHLIGKMPDGSVFSEIDDSTAGFRRSPQKGDKYRSVSNSYDNCLKQTYIYRLFEDNA